MQLLTYSLLQFCYYRLFKKNLFTIVNLGSVIMPEAYGRVWKHNTLQQWTGGHESVKFNKTKLNLWP